MATTPLTVEGEARLRAELEQLKRVDRPRIVEAIAEARAHGDLKENAEYHAAREQQGFAEGRIAEIEQRLGKASVIDPLAVNANGRIVFGATVTMVNVDDDSEVCYQIVGVDEAEIKKGKVSYQSPIARAMIGKEVDDEAVVPAPGGAITYEILKIEYV